MQDKNYKVLEAQFRKTWEGKFGPMSDYALKLEGVDDWVQLSQKPDTPAPVAGQELFGHTMVQTFGDKSYLKFKKVNPNYNGPTGGSGGGSYGGAASKEDTQYMITLLEAIAREVVGDAVIRTTDMLPPDDALDQPIDLSEIPF